MDDSLTKLQQKVAQIMKDEVQHEEYWREFYVTLKMKLLDVLYENASAENKKRLAELTEKVDLNKYFEVLEQEFKQTTLYPKLQQVYTEYIESELAKFK